MFCVVFTGTFPWRHADQWNLAASVVAAVVVAVVVVVVALTAAVVGVENSVVVGAPRGAVGWRGVTDGVRAGALGIPQESCLAAAHSCPVATSGDDAASSSSTATCAGPSSAGCGDPSLIRVHDCQRCSPLPSIHTLLPPQLLHLIWHLYTPSQVAACVVGGSGVASSSSDSKQWPMTSW